MSEGMKIGKDKRGRNRDKVRATGMKMRNRDREKRYEEWVYER